MGLGPEKGKGSGGVGLWSMLWGFQVEEFQRKEVITQRVSKGGVKIWTQNKEGFIHQHKNSKKSCRIFQG